MRTLIGLALLPFKLAAGVVFAVFALVAALLVCLIGLIPGAVALLCLAGTVFWIWMLVDVVRNDRLSGWERVGWALVVWFLPFLGGAAYFFLGRGSAPSGRLAAA